MNHCISNIISQLDRIEAKVDINNEILEKMYKKTNRKRIDIIKTNNRLSKKQAWISCLVQKYNLDAHTSIAYDWLVKHFPNFKIALGTYRAYISVLDNSGVIKMVNNAKGDLVYVINPKNSWIEKELKQFKERYPDWEKM